MNARAPNRPAPRQASISLRGAGAADMVLPVIERLQQTLDAEIEQIAARKRVDYQAFNLRKSQGLLELTRLAPALAGAEASPALRASLNALRAKLEVNRRMLRVQLNAAQEVSDIISRAIQEGQSDGTYSEFSWRD